MRALRTIAAALALLLTGIAPLQAQVATQAPLTGAHPEDHGPTTSAAPTADDKTVEDKTVVVTGKHRRPGLFRRVGHFFHRIFHGKRRWYTTPSHRNHCKQKFRSYNPRTNSYRAYSGVVRKCVV